jgi:hypothetical protein
MSGRHLPFALVLATCTPEGQLDPARPVILAGGLVPCTANPDCEDFDPCSTDACDLSGGSPGTCTNTAIPSCCRNDSECPSDGEVCTREICHGTAHTCSSVPIFDCCDSVADPCADGSSCTLDGCDVGSGTCTHTPGRPSTTSRPSTVTTAS